MSIYPGDYKAAKNISHSIGVKSSHSDTYYLEKVEDGLRHAFENFKPDFVIYNAGTDCMAGDPLGALRITPRGIISRDELVFRYCLEETQTPVVMILSGGY